MYEITELIMKLKSLIANQLKIIILAKRVTRCRIYLKVGRFVFLSTFIYFLAPYYK